MAFSLRLSPNKMALLHPSLASGRWQKMSLAEQLGNIGSEVARAEHAQDPKLYAGAVARALELFDLTLADERWRPPAWRAGGRLREIERAKEVFCDALTGGKEYGSSLPDLERYFLEFAFLARRGV